MDQELRKTYLGATDLVAICGLSPWRKPGDVWMEKTGRALGFEGNAATELGTDLEPVVAARHARRRQKLGEIVQLGELPDPVYDKEFPFIAANVDRIYLNRKRVLECKTAAEQQLSDARYPWGEDGEVDQVPVYYYAQTNHYIGLLEFEDAFLSALFLGRQRIQRDYPIQFNPNLFQKMRQAGVTFWKTYVEPNVQPPAEMFGPVALMQLLAEAAQPHGGKKGIPAEPDEYLEKLAAEYQRLSRAIDDLDRSKGAIGGKVAAWITQHAATKVFHSLGSFTFQKPEEKPDYPETNFEEAWKALQREIALIPPDKLLVDLHGLLSKVLTDHTQIVHPETGKARLHVYWKK